MNEYQKEIEELVRLMKEAGFTIGKRNQEYKESGFVAPLTRPRSEIDSHEYVDLGLSVKWATCNVGATSPEGYGYYFAWGETSPKSSYTEDNSKTYKKDYGDIAGNPALDAARANWGGTWRLPTVGEIYELLDNCNKKWTTMNGVKGYRFKSKENGNSIFLPAAGIREGSSLKCAGSDACFWSSTPFHSPDKDCAYILDFVDLIVNYNYRYFGSSVRPVSEW